MECNSRSIRFGSKITFWSVNLISWHRDAIVIIVSWRDVGENPLASWARVMSCVWFDNSSSFDLSSGKRFRGNIYRFGRRIPSRSGAFERHGMCSRASVIHSTKFGGGLMSLTTLSLNLSVISLRLCR